MVFGKSQNMIGFASEMEEGYLWKFVVGLEPHEVLLFF